MQKRSTEQAWKVALAAIALVATVMALYIQLFERRSRQEEERLAAARLEEVLAESRVRLRAEILTQLRAEGEKSTQPPGDQPLPGAVLRRGESGALEQFVGPLDAQQAQAITELRESLDVLSRQLEQSELARRRELEELRADVRRDLDASGRTVSLLLVAVIPLVAQLLFSLWQPRRRRPGEAGAER
jgi:hypothetical protein